MNNKKMMDMDYTKKDIQNKKELYVTPTATVKDVEIEQSFLQVSGSATLRSRRRGRVLNN